MEARAKAFILCLVLNVPIFSVMLLNTDEILLAVLLIAMLTTSTLLLGFALSPDARPPRVPPRTHTAKTVLIPLGFSALSQTVNLLTGYHAPSYYIESPCLPFVAFFSLTWLVGAFAARRLDSYYEPKSRKWHEAWRIYYKKEDTPDINK